MVVCGSDADRARIAAERLGPTARWSVHDLTNPRERRTFVEAAATELGGLDVLVVRARPCARHRPRHTRRGLSRSPRAQPDLGGPHVPGGRFPHAGRQLGPHRGDHLPRRPPALTPCRVAEYGSLRRHGVPLSLAGEVAAHGITVDSVQPGLGTTDRVGQVFGEDDSDALATALRAIPAGRLGEADPSHGTHRALLLYQGLYPLTGSQINGFEAVAGLVYR